MYSTPISVLTSASEPITCAHCCMPARWVIDKLNAEGEELGEATRACDRHLPSLAGELSFVMALQGEQWARA